MKIEPNFFGKYGFYWWIGVVEDRLGDPLKLGRVRVRILGAHTENKQLIPTPELHWAYVYTSSINPAMSGLGRSPTGLLEGTWVFGFFKDSDHAQDPVVIGTLGGIPQEAAKPSIGFNDPSAPIHDLPNAPRKIFYRHYPNDGTGAQLKNEHTGKTYPRDVHPWGCVVGEADTNRLARAEKVEDTIMGVRLRQRDVGRPGPEFGGIPIAFVHPNPTRKWVEPKPGSHTSDGESTYPYVHVFESESGHIIEIDDTPNKERIHIWHRSGTYLEIGSGQEEDPGLHGNLTLKCVGKRFEVTMEQAYSHFQNTMNVTVDGECNIYCRNDANLQVDGDLKVHVKGNYEEKVHGNYTTDIDGDRTVKIGGFDKTEVKGNHSMHAGGTSDRHSGGPMFDIAGGPIKQSAGGAFTMASAGTLSGDAPAVHWNSGMGSTSSPASPQAPTVPPFPEPIRDWFESRNDSDKDPKPEEKPDPDPPMYDGPEEQDN